MFKFANRKYVTVLKPGHPLCSCGKSNCDKRGHSKRQVVESDYAAVPWLSILPTHKLENIVRYTPSKQNRVEIPQQRKAPTHSCSACEEAQNTPAHIAM